LLGLPAIPAAPPNSLLSYSHFQEKFLACRKRLPYFLKSKMQHDEHNEDDVAASERARQRAKRVQKTHSKKSKD
jgi:hypothetical protein